MLSESQWGEVGRCFWCEAILYEKEGVYRWNPDWLECNHELKGDEDATSKGRLQPKGQD